MSRLMQLISLLLVLIAGSTALPAQDGQVSTAAASGAIYPRLHSSNLYERRKALDELLSVAPDAQETVEVLIRQFQSKDMEEARYMDFMQRVEQALQRIAGNATWSADNVDLLTSVLVHNDAYDARATNRTASTVAGVARYQVFSPRAIDDLTTVLWHRVDRNPNRTRNDSTRSYVVQALQHIHKRQGLPQAVVDACVASLGSERNAGVRRAMVVLITELARAQPASEAMVQALTGTLQTDDNAAVRALAARSLRLVSEQRDYPRSLLDTLRQAAAGDPDAAVRREALAGLMAAATVYPSSPGPLSPEAVAQLLQAAAGDTDARQRSRALQAIGRIYATRAPDPAVLDVLLTRLGEEDDRKVRAVIAVTLQEIQAHQGLAPALIEPLIPLVTDDPVAEVRQAIRRMFIDAPAGQGLAAWMQASMGAGLSPASAASTVALLHGSSRHPRVEQSALQARLLAQYVTALSGGRALEVREEILQGLFALSLAESLSPPAVAVLARSLDADPDAGVRLQAAAVLLHNGLQYRRDTGPFYPALDDGDAQVRDYAAFALVELSAGDGDVLPGLLGYARDASAHRNLRGYCLRRLALWQRAGRVLPDTVQATLLELTGEPDVELSQAAWSALRQFDLARADWRRAAADDDLVTRRMAWQELEVLGVDKTLWAKWRDPKQRLQLIAVGLLGAQLLVVVAGAVLFFWRLLVWWRGTRQQRGKMLAAQLLWLVAALSTVAVNAGIVFIVAVSHVGLSEKDLMQLNTTFGVILALYAAVTYLGWKLLPARSSATA